MFPPTCFSGRPMLSETGFDLLNKLLTYDPDKVVSFTINTFQVSPSRRHLINLF
jgi:hypothetical protein